MNKSDSARRAKVIYDRLMGLPRPHGLTNYDWTVKAGVSTSFFTGLRNGSEPSIGNLRSVLEAVDITLPEFFVSEARGRLVPPPTTQALAEAIEAALPELPRRPDKRARYLAEVVQAYLRIPGGLPASSDLAIDPTEEDGPARASTI